MPRRLGLGAGLLATALIALGAPAYATPAPAPAPSATADPMLGAPAVGECFDLSSEELAAPVYTEAPVDCSVEHTSSVIAVTLLPDGLSYTGKGLERFALESCLPAQRKAIGTSLVRMRLTAYHLGYFGPTPEQQAAGARWLRCDLVLGSLSDLQALPARLDVGPHPFGDRVSRCLAGRDFHLTVCSARHTYRATGAIKVTAKRFPSEAARTRIGTERCRDATSSRVYRFGWPAKVAWRAGDRTLICYSQTRR